MTLTELFTNIANAIREKKGTTESIVAEDFPSEIESIESGGDITAYFSNNLFNGSNSYSGFGKSILKIPDNIVVNGTTLSNAFSGLTSITSVPMFDTSNVTYFNRMFFSCEHLEAIPQFNTENATSMGYMFMGCSSLTTIPILDTSKVNNTNGFTNFVQGCTELSDESLNNIMKMMINATSYTSTKTLKYIGLTQVQATTCQSLSNYADFIAAGWTTGY